MAIDHMSKSNIRPWRIAVVLAGVLLLPTLLMVSGCAVATVGETTVGVDSQHDAALEATLVDPEVLDKKPELIGGLSALAGKVNYPRTAREARIQGKVNVRFVVDEQGNVRNAQVVEGIGHGCDTEALRVVRSLRFHPGQKDGKPVNVQMTMPITFKLKRRFYPSSGWR